ncbi:MAG: hypothetical protein AAFP19_26065 [Bacteroidota bacterium]
MKFEHCPFTHQVIDPLNLKESHYQEEYGIVTYQVQCRDRELHFRVAFNGKQTGDDGLVHYHTGLPLEEDHDQVYESQVHLITGAILNGHIKTRDYVILLSESVYPDSIQQITAPGCIIFPRLLEEFLSSHLYPKRESEKFENLLLTIMDYESYAGEKIDVGIFLQKHPIETFYLKNYHEMRFYLNSLMNKGYLVSKTPEGSMPTSFQLTYDGLFYGMALQEAGSQSKKCFIAMSFGEAMGPIREAIKKACIDTGFQPVLIDETHFSSDQTINDAIIAEIRKCRFCIADFTEQKDGVYFEAGFALGQGKPVIYSCHQDWWGKTHFDTKHFPHIIFEKEEELYRQLVSKIGAWII